MLLHRHEARPADEASSSDLPIERLSQRAYLAIRTSLRLGELRPGEKLILRPLAAKLGLSATPVREALLRLVSEQALGLDERSSVTIPTLDVDDLEEIRELRMDLEGRAAELTAARAGDTVRGNLETIARRFADAERAGDRHECNWQDDRFHREILLAAGRPMLVKLVENLQVRTGPLMAFADQAGAADGRSRLHARMLDAVERRDGALGRAAMVEGLETLFAHLRNVAEQTAGRVPA